MTSASALGRDFDAGSPIRRKENPARDFGLAGLRHAT